MDKHKAHMTVTAGLALGMLATIAAATPAIAETTDTATPTTISATNTGDILTPDANGDVTYTNDNGATTKVSIVISGNGSKDENTGDFTVPVLTYDKSNDDVTFRANFNPNQGGMAMTGYTKIENATGNYETNSWEDDYSDSLPYTIDENGVTHINIHDTFNISTQDIDGNEEKYGGVAATWMKSWAAYDNFKLQVNKGNGEYASNDSAVTFTPTAEDMGNGFTIPKASLPTKEGYHIKAFRTDKYNQDVPVNFTTDGNAVLSLAELTHTRIMADGATHYSRADTWFNSITPIFEADEVTPTPTPEPDPTPDPVTPPTPGTDDSTPTDGVQPTIEPVEGKNTVMFYSGKLNKGETSITNTGEHADVVAPNSEYSLADGTMVKRWVSTDGNIVLMPGGHYDADSIKDKVFVADYVTNSPHDYDPNQEYPQNVSQIQLIFHGNGGVDEHGAIQYATSGDPSATDLPVRPTYTREGYTFKGWSRNGYGTEVNVITVNNMINLKSIGKRSVMADPNDPHKVIVVYNVYAIWEKDEATPDNPVTPPAPDTPDTPGETPDTVTPDNPVTPGNQNSTSSTNETPSQSTDTEKTSKKKTDNPETGDAASSAGIIAGVGAIFTSLGVMRKRRNQ